MKRKSKKRLEMGEKNWSEYQRLRKNNKAINYKIRNADKVIYWRQRVKVKLIEYKGGKCQICGYDKMCPNAYAFHHRDPSKKELTISGLTLAFDRLKKEADKCDLLCVRCHAEIHDKDFEEKRRRGAQKLAERRENKLSPIVCICGKVFHPENRKRKYCSEKCARLSLRKVARPTKSQLKEDIENLTWVAIGKKYFVSDNAVRKWARNYGLGV